MTIWIVTVEHRHGHDNWVSHTEAGAISQLATYCRENWEDSAAPDAEIPEDDQQCVELYFDENTIEFYSCGTAELDEQVPA